MPGVDRLGGRLQRDARSPSPACIEPAGVSASTGVGDELRRMFDDVVSSPMPKSMLDLCEALEDAFRRGDLRGGERAKDA